MHNFYLIYGICYLVSFVTIFCMHRNSSIASFPELYLVKESKVCYPVLWEYVENEQKKWISRNRKGLLGEGIILSFLASFILFFGIFLVFILSVCLMKGTIKWIHYDDIDFDDEMPQKS